jgi:hypothetical protein
VAFACAKQIKKALRGVKVEVTHRGNVRRKYRISGVTAQPTHELMCVFIMCTHAIIPCEIYPTQIFKKHKSIVQPFDTKAKHH